MSCGGGAAARVKDGAGEPYRSTQFMFTRRTERLPPSPQVRYARPARGELIAS
jgi:hypothetical protein